MAGKLCKLAGCDRVRFQIRTLCLWHIRERERAKKAENKAKRLARKQASKKHQQSELKKWKAKCWKLMSEWVRRSAADWRGYVQCYTCDEWLPWREAHAGHHFHGKLDYDPRNLRVQNASCNTYRGGMLNVYARKLIEENGMEWYRKLEADAAQHPGYSLEDCKRIHAELSAKLSTLQ